MKTWLDNKLEKVSEAINKKLFPKEDKRKVKKLVESSSFDFFIMSIILADAVVLGLLTSNVAGEAFAKGLFLLDRLFMGIFIVEMIMKIYAEGRSFFKSGWNVFDFVIVAVSSVPFASAFIVLRTFRLFRLIKYIHHFSKMHDIVAAFIALIPTFLSFMAVFAVFLYVFSIIAVSLYGDVFIEFSTLGSAMLISLQTFALDGWSMAISKQVMQVFPHAWLFFMCQGLVAFMLVTSFVVTAVVQTYRQAIKK